MFFLWKGLEDNSLEGVCKILVEDDEAGGLLAGDTSVEEKLTGLELGELEAGEGREGTWTESVASSGGG